MAELSTVPLDSPTTTTTAQYVLYNVYPYFLYTGCVTLNIEDCAFGC